MNINTEQKKVLKISFVVLFIMIVGIALYFYSIKDILVLYKNVLNENEEYYDLSKENDLSVYYQCKPEYPKIKANFLSLPWHGFKKEKIYIWYNKECFENDSSESKMGSRNIPVELEIEKTNGEWKIINRYEKQ